MVFSVTILGSSSATPTSTRNPSSILVNLDYNFFLMDCGEGTQMQLRRYRIKLQKINHIFISHLHGDHFFGLIGLISTCHLLGRDKPLHIYGNQKLEEIIRIQLEASQTILKFPLQFHLTDPDIPEVVLRNNTITVTSFPLDHKVPTTGFLFTEKARARKIKKGFVAAKNIQVGDIIKIKAGEDFTDENGEVFKNADISIAPPPPRSFAYCSDTRFFEPVVAEIKGADLLYHEATFMDDMRDIAVDKYHSTASDAGRTALLAEVDKLIIGHFSARYKELEKLLLEAREVFPETTIADEGMTFKIPLKKK